MMPTEQPVRVRRRAARWWFVALAAAAVALFAVLAAVHAALYSAPAPFAMLLAAAMCGAPIVALRRPRTAIALFCVAAFLLPLLVLPGRDERSDDADGERHDARAPAVPHGHDADE